MRKRDLKARVSELKMDVHMLRERERVAREEVDWLKKELLASYKDNAVRHREAMQEAKGLVVDVVAALIPTPAPDLPTSTDQPSLFDQDADWSDEVLSDEVLPEGFGEADLPDWGALRAFNGGGSSDYGSGPSIYDDNLGEM